MRGIGYFLGATLGASLLFFIISFLFLRPKNISKTEIIKYIENSDRLLIKEIDWVGGILANDDERLGIKTISKMIYFSNRNMSYVRATTYTYFSKEFNKYIRTYSISEGYFGEVLLDFGDKDKDRNIWPDMYFYYNKIQNADPSYGTIEKPLPILHFRSANPALRSMRQNNRDSDPAYLKRQIHRKCKTVSGVFYRKRRF